MSYIIKNTNPFVSIKLTELGREQLALGQLNFTSWAIGDSEINYEREVLVDNAVASNDATLSGSSIVMRPFDRQPNIKSFITRPTDSTPLQPINGGNATLNVVKATVNNQAEERGFFTGTTGSYTTLTSTTYASYTTLIPNTSISGTSVLNLPTTSGLNNGDILLIKVGNDVAGSSVANNNSTPIPNLFYGIESVETSTRLILDRPLPNLSASTASTQVIVYRGGEVYDTIATGTTTAYWDTGTLQFEASSNVTCFDVPVWNMNNVWCENIAGITGLTTTNLYEDYTKFGSYAYLGTKNPYLEYACTSTAETPSLVCDAPGLSYPDDVTKSVSIIHFTNNSISSLYGEFLYIDTTSNKTVKIDLPDLMYHRRNYSTGSGTTMGMRFVASGSTKYIGNSEIEYVDLIEDPTLIASGMTALAVGKVFPQLKMVVIDNDEIVSAISYKSNRNWTLPQLAANLANPSGGTSTGVLPINSTIYLTYILENSGTTGLTTSLHCQNYVKVTNNTSSAKDIAFRINDVDLLPYMRKFESASYDGLGFYAKSFKLLYQIVSTPNTRPDPGAWKEYDFTSTAITGVAGQTIDPKLLENQTPTNNGFVLDIIKDAASNTFSIIEKLNMPLNAFPTRLQFGNERFFYGNLNTYIGATIYKTIFDINVDSSSYSLTSNPTRSTDTSTIPPNIKITEVGIYDSDNNLVCVGKLSQPVALVAGNTITLELSMDF